MAALMTSAGAVFSALVGNLGTLATTVMTEGNEVLLLPIIVGVAGIGFKIFKSFAHI